MDKLDNKMKAVLAEFDGFKMVRKGMYQNKSHFIIHEIHINNLDYDTDWNWVVPIYRKVCPLIDSLQNSDNVEINSLTDAILWNLLEPKETPEPLAIALYNFITFYNEHKGDTM